jgi:hypothetical protein
MSTNAIVLDDEDGLFRVLGFLDAEVNFPYLTNCDDIDSDFVKGVTFSFIDDKAYPIASIGDFTIADVSDDTAEPEISGLTEEDVSLFDKQLREAIEIALQSEGNKLLRWAKSYLIFVDEEPCLMTAYVAHVAGEERQYVTARYKIAGRNIVLMGSFLVRLTDEMLPLILVAMGRVRPARFDS